jgi:uncharacterized protein (TIGR03000 family)
MFRRNLAHRGLRATAVALVVLAASPAAAQQQGWPVNRGGYNGFSQGGFGGGFSPAQGYVAPPTSFAPFAMPYAPPAAVPSAPASEVRSFYPSTAADEYGALSTPAAGKRPVLITVSVRPDAQILFGEAQTTQSGARRAFVSPPLAPGRDYVYEVTARWQEGGREVVQTRRVTVHAGDVINLSF